MPNQNFDAISRLAKLAELPNIAATFDENKISEAGSQAVEEYRIDRQSRSTWEKTAKEAMASVLQEKKEKNYPYPGASNVQFPLLTTASLQFAARAYPAIVNGPKLVRCQIIGADKDDRKKKRADRIETHMSYQLSKDIPEWETDIDTMLHQLPVLGCGFKKVYWSHEEQRPASKLISAFDLVVNQGATSLETVPRITHRFDLYPYEIEQRIRSETFTRFDYKSAPDALEDDLRRQKELRSQDQLAPQTFLEQHRYHDLDGDGYAEPWIFTIHEASEKVVRVAANYDLQRATLNSRNELVTLPRYNYFVKYGFIPDPEGGFYDVGFGRLLASLSATINTLLNLAIDAAHHQNAGGGFIGSGLSLKRSTMRFEPGVYHVVEAAGQAIRDAVVQMTHAGPSGELTALLQALIEFGREITSTQEIMTGEAGRAQPATTTLAQIEQGLKLFTAAYKRIFRALGQEFKLIYDINGRYPNEEKYAKIIDWQPVAAPLPQPALAAPGAPAMGGPLTPEGQPGAAPMPAQGVPGMAGQSGQGPDQQLPGMAPSQPTPEQPPTMQQDYDYDDCDLIPVADPNMVTDMQRMAKSQLQMELAGHPTIGPTMNAAEVGRRVLQAASVEDIHEIIPEKTGPSPIEELQLRGAQAEVAVNETKAELTKAQAQKTMMEAETIPAKTEMEKAKVTVDALDKDRRFALDHDSAANDADRADRDFDASRFDADRDHESGRQERDNAREESDRQFRADQYDKAYDTLAQEREHIVGREDKASELEAQEREYELNMKQAMQSNRTARK